MLTMASPQVKIAKRSHLVEVASEHYINCRSVSSIFRDFLPGVVSC